MYTFREQCAEEIDLLLKDGAVKIFLNMTNSVELGTLATEQEEDILQ